MRYQKDDQIKYDAEIKAMHPNTSFGPNTFAELGWEPYAEPAPPTPQTDRRAEIIAELDEIDRKSIRALRENDAARIATWEQTAQALRDELASLPPPPTIPGMLA